MGNLIQYRGAVYRRADTTIRWARPDLQDEVGEYTENEFTRDAFAQRGLVLPDEQAVLDFLHRGKLLRISHAQIEALAGAGRLENITSTEEEFAAELSDPEYRDSYDSMEAALNHGNLVLPAPILIKFGPSFYGFAGNRRTNLARRHNQDVVFWVVDATSGGPH